MKAESKFWRLVKKNTPISEAIIEISSKKLGITLVQDGKKIIGIFTDGDLRRFLNENTNPSGDSNRINLSGKPAVIFPQLVSHTSGVPVWPV